jgi:DNA-binding NarL/FixJ family response regulator
MNVSHNDSFDSDELDAINRAQQELDKIIRAVVNRDRADLTLREIEVLTHLAMGKTNPQIAEDMSVVRRTVATHIENILMKLGVNNRVQAVVAGIKLGLIDLKLR